MPAKQAKLKDTDIDKKIIIKIGHSRQYHDSLSKDLSQETMKRLKTAIQRQLKEIDEHMQTDGWPLDYAAIKDEILGETFSRWINWYIMSRICSRGYLVGSHPECKSGLYVQKESSDD